MRIELFGPTGERHPLEVEFPVDAKCDPNEPTQLVPWSFALALQNVVFGAEGRHEFRLLFDKRQLGTVALYVKRQTIEQGDQK